MPALLLFAAAGVIFSAKLGLFQFNIAALFKNTIFRKSVHKKDKSQPASKNLSPFQALASALAVTLGTGNIVALGTAIAFGGAGAVFWMWVSAFGGMATSYAENFLGMRYRRRRRDGSYIGGAFYYIEHALGKHAGLFYAACCLLASFGMGNMTQVNAAATALRGSFGVPAFVTGAFTAAVVALLIFGGVKIFGEVTEKAVPLLSLIYVGGCVLVMIIFADRIPGMFARIFSEAFDFRAVGGGILGSAMLKGMGWGYRRGVFSNEAGLGSAVILNTMSEETAPARQGQWAMLAVFFDTIVMCTLTAFAILLTGADRGVTDGGAFAATAFENAFGPVANAFVSVSVALFAVATIAGYSVLAKISAEYLFSGRLIKPVMFLYISCCLLGSVANLQLVWEAADLFNGIMAVPNLLSLLLLNNEVTR